MKRPTYKVTLHRPSTGETTIETRHALNSGVRASEGMVRQVARAAGWSYEGLRPVRVGDTYTREWRNVSADEPLLIATVQKVED